MSRRQIRTGAFKLGKGRSLKTTEAGNQERIGIPLAPGIKISTKISEQREINEIYEVWGRLQIFPNIDDEFGLDLIDIFQRLIRI